MKAYVHTFGCQMNVYDSARMAERLEALGYTCADEPADADLVLINSCSIRLKAEQKMLSALGRYARIKRRRPHMKLVLAGCTAELRGEEIWRRVPELDLVLGPDWHSRLEQWLTDGDAREVRVGRVDEKNFRFLNANPTAGRNSPVCAEVTVMKGCDNRCAYCVVPAARGPQINRPAEQILEEVDRLVGSGTREITLIGQNVNAYQGACGGFSELVESVAARPGVLRVRFVTSHPRDLDRDLAEVMARIPNVCKHLHLPVQSGSDRVLEAMGRGYTRDEYLTKVSWMHELIPEATVSSDFIVGFPGETEADFGLTLDLIRTVGFSFVYSFAFSGRPNTRAALMENDTTLKVTDTDKRRRLHELQELQSKIRKRHLEGWVGRSAEILVEGPSRRGGNQLMGRTSTFEIVNFYVESPADSDKVEQSLIGSLADVKISAAGNHTLEGLCAPLRTGPTRPFEA